MKISSRTPIIYIALSCLFLICSCHPKKEQNKQNNTAVDTILKPKYAKGFFITKKENQKELHICNGRDTTSYILTPNTKTAFNSTKNSLPIPCTKLIASSTTDIPFIEALNATNSLVGFAETKYISSTLTRKRIAQGKIKDIGSLDHPNSETLISLEAELLLTSSPPEALKVKPLLKQSNTTVLQNTSWLEAHPLGRLEWIKLFGYLFNKTAVADSIFEKISSNYLQIKNIAASAERKPTVLSGNLYKDVWYAPAANSFETQFINDANGDYVWKHKKGTGSLSLSLEIAIDQGNQADIWLGGGLFETREALLTFENKYTSFNAVINNEVYTKDTFQGPTGGIWYYETGILHPDWILEDLVRIFHPNLLPNKPLYFYRKLK